VAGTESEARLLAIKGNSACADCMTSDPVHYPNTPAWGSCNLGCLFCIRCAGIHRKMGVHVSKVLSIRIDTWSEEQLQAMEAKGNAAVNAELEAEVGGSVKDKLRSQSWLRTRMEKLALTLTPALTRYHATWRSRT